MKRVKAALYGATAGAVTALVFLPLVVGRLGLHTLEHLDDGPSFVIGSGSLYMLTVVLGLVGGLIISVIVYAFSREAEPETQRFPLGYLLPAGAITAALFAYAVLRLGVGGAGTIGEGVVTVSVVSLTGIVLVTGAVAGGITAALVDALARPEFLGLEGEAVPESGGTMFREMLEAIGAPMISMIAIAIFAIALSQLLLAVDGMAAAVTVLSLVAAAVLGGATLIALRPWDRSS